MTIEQIVKEGIMELLAKKGTITAKRSTFSNSDFNFEEFLKVYPNAESFTLSESGEIIVTEKEPVQAPKMLKVIGNTYAVKGTLKQYGFKWDAKQKAWFGSEDKKDAMISGLPTKFESLSKEHVLALTFEEV